MLEMLRHLGVGVEHTPEAVTLDASSLTTHEAPLRTYQEDAGVVFGVGSHSGALRAEARVALPGGCDIGARPVDYHLKGLERMGARITVEHGFVRAVAPRGLRGAAISLDFPSVGATTHLMTAAALADGVTTISNAAEEPDVIACADLLNAMGARVRGAGSKEVMVEGVKTLHGAEYTVDPDRIEAGTFAVAAAITGGDLYLRGAVEEHTRPVMRKLAEAGVEVRFDDDGARVRLPHGRRLQAVKINASPHPGFPTDMQPPFAALLTLAEGTSVITETVYERRFKYIDEMARMGADIKAQDKSAIIIGVPRLTGAPVAGSDLRAAAALILAGLAAEGQTEVSGIVYLDRGYEDFVGKLAAVGADIRREAAPSRVPERAVV